MMKLTDTNRMTALAVIAGRDVSFGAGNKRIATWTERAAFVRSYLLPGPPLTARETAVAAYIAEQAYAEIAYLTAARIEDAIRRNPYAARELMERDE
jgi:hypothetical protein